MNTRDSVLACLKRSDRPLTPTEAATRLALPYERVKKAMQRMARAGELVNDNGRYRVPDAQAVDVPATEPGDNGPRFRDHWYELSPEPVFYGGHHARTPAPDFSPRSKCLGPS